ncbi:MAG: HAMP domain-containing protein [Chloroflexi bacterium]|nr:MAG: HAMP domain-containing protein [Chloroflexota bacterium]
MINKWLRRISVQYRIVGGFLTLLLFAALSALLLVSNQFFLVDRLEQATNVEARADRFLLLASARVESSRVNLSRYTQGLTPSPYESRNDVEEAIGFLQEAQGFVVSNEQRADIQLVLAALGNYQVLIDSVEAITQESGSSSASQAVFQTYRLGNDIGQRIEQTVADSEARLTEVNEAVFAQARNRFLTFIGISVFILAFSLVFSWIVSQSIVQPVHELQSGAEAFEKGKFDTAIAVSGTDELSSLGTSFNQMTAQIRDLVVGLEQRVADRTRALETSNEVGRSLSKILDIDELTSEVVKQIRDAFNYYHAHIYLFDNDKQNLVLAGGTGRAGKEMLARGHQIPKEKGLVGRAAATNTPIFIENVIRAADWLPNPLLPETKTEVAVPIAIGDEVLGVLDVQHNHLDSLNEDDISLLQSIAVQVAFALQNARIYSIAQTQAKREAVINDINRRIQMATDINTVLQVAAREVGKALGAKQVDVQIGKTVNGNGRNHHS